METKYADIVLCVSKTLYVLDYNVTNYNVCKPGTRGDLISPLSFSVLDRTNNDTEVVKSTESNCGGVIFVTHIRE